MGLSICPRTDARGATEESAKVALVLKPQPVGNFLHGKLGGEQQSFGLSNEILYDTIARTSPENLLNNLGQVLGCEA